MSIVTPQRKRNDLTLADKVKVIQLMDSVPKMSQTEVAEKFGCSQPQVSRTYKNRAAILQRWGCNRDPNGKRKREGKNSEVEDALYRWYVNAMARSSPVNGPILMVKAKALAEGLGYLDFKPTDGWLSRWKRRHNLLSSQREGSDSSLQFFCKHTDEDIRQETRGDIDAASVKIEPADNNDDSPRLAVDASREHVEIEGALVAEERKDTEVCRLHNSVDPTVETELYEARSVTSDRVGPAAAANDAIIPSNNATPTLSQLQESFDVIRQWMRINDFPEYSNLLAIEGKIHDFCRKAKKQKVITQFFKPTSK